jgi:arginase
MKNRPETKSVAVIGMPIDYSAYGHAEGCDKGPRAIREAGLVRGLRRYGVRFADYGDIALPKSRRPGDVRMKFLAETVESAKLLYGKVSDALARGLFPVTIGGDHAGSIGAIRAVNDHHKGALGVLWLDAHLDSNTRATTTSGNIHGMVIPQLSLGGEPALSAIGEYPMRPRDFVPFGIRNPDPAELDYVKRHKVSMIDIWEVEGAGVAKALAKAIGYLKRNKRKIYASIDLDCVDIAYAPGVGTPTHGGLTYREAIYIARELRGLYERGMLAGLDIMEMNPRADKGGKTAGLAVEMILSILGYEYGPFVIFRDKRGPLE